MTYEVRPVPAEIDKGDPITTLDVVYKDYGYEWVQSNYSREAIQGMSENGLFKVPDDIASRHEKMKEIVSSFGVFA